MPLTDTYNRRLYICLPHQPRSTKWVEQILHHLWDYGMNFPTFQFEGHQPVTWDELLNALDVEMENRETFRERIPQLAQSGGTLFTAHDLGWPSLRFNVQRHSSLDWIVLSLQGLELEPYWKRKREQHETPLGYIAVYQAFLEWAKVLCEIVQPLFGFGYCEGYLTDFDAYYEYVNLRGEVPQSGKIPPIDTWFSHPPLRYLSPTVLTPDLQRDLLSRERWQLERLTTGGIFVTPPDPAYTYIAYGGYSALHRSDQTGKDIEQEQQNTSDLLELAETRRALTIFTALNETNGIHQAQGYLSFLENTP